MLPTRREFLKTAVAAYGSAGFGTSTEWGSASNQKPDDLTALSLRAAGDLLRARKVSPVELTNACLARIERLNPRPERVHHCESRSSARRCKKSGIGDRARPDTWAATRYPDRSERSVRH
jgi:hypothetical protein